jgi:hypothetical protein
MSTFRPLFAALAMAACGGAAIAAQSATVARGYTVPAFDKVAAAGANGVIVHLGGAPSVRAQGPAKTLDKMEVVVERGGLPIRPRREYRNDFDWRGLEPATYTVTLPRLTDAALAGSGEMRIDRAEGDRFAATVAGSGYAEITAKDTANVSIVGSGDALITGGAHCAVTRIGSGRAHCG